MAWKIVKSFLDISHYSLQNDAKNSEMITAYYTPATPIKNVLENNEMITTYTLITPREKKGENVDMITAFIPTTPTWIIL